jgi:hypothetical protein
LSRDRRKDARNAFSETTLLVSRRAMESLSPEEEHRIPMGDYKTAAPLRKRHNRNAKTSRDAKSAIRPRDVDRGK